MFRAHTSSLALIVGLFLMEGCQESPVGVDDRIGTGTGAKQEPAASNGAVALYVSSGGTNNVLAFDAEDGSFESKFARHGGLIEPEGLAFGPDGNLYVTSRSDEVLRYDGATGAFLDVFASGNGLVDPAGIGFCGPGNDLFVASGLTDEGGGNQILRFDGVTGAFEAVVDPANLAGLNDPEVVVCGPDGLLYVTSTPEVGPGEVIRYSPVTNAYVSTFVPAPRPATSWIRPVWSSVPTATCSSAAQPRARSSATTAPPAPSRVSSSPSAWAASMRPRAWRSARTAACSSRASWATRCWSMTEPPALSCASS